MIIFFSIPSAKPQELVTCKFIIYTTELIGLPFWYGSQYNSVCLPEWQLK